MSMHRSWNHYIWNILSNAVRVNVTSGTELQRKSTIIAYFIALLLIAVTGVACASLDPESESTSTADKGDTSRQRSAQIGPDDEGLDIAVGLVSDGDSLRADSAETALEIRLLGINAPERDDCFGDAARDELRALLATGPVTLHPWPGETDQFGRQLGFLMANGTFVNLSLIESGHVVARAQSDHGFQEEFEAAERSASAAGIGLWAADACGTPTDAEVEIIDVQEDAPGDDRENPNGEWVLIENAGSSAIDFTGWMLRDESTRHRFDIPGVTLEAGSSIRIFSGCGVDELEGTPMELYWCDTEPPVWNNDGDTAFLLDPNGAIADSYLVKG
jgi:endonuclease YncB( thermonuclease family)